MAEWQGNTDWREARIWRVRRWVSSHPDGDLHMSADEANVYLGIGDYGGGPGAAVRIPRDKIDAVIEALQSVPEPPSWAVRDG